MSTFTSSVFKLKYFYIIIFASSLFTACSDDEVTKSSLAKVEINGEVTDYEVKDAQYSHIRKRFELTLIKGSNLLNVFIRVDDQNTLTTGNIDTSCELYVDTYHDGLIATTLYTDIISKVSIDKVDKKSDAYAINITGKDIELGSIGSSGESELTISSLELSVTFDIPSVSGLDEISFSIRGDDYTYYGDNASGYFAPNFFSEVELVISANILDVNPSSFTGEGISIIDASPMYPPVKGVLNGYQDGLRISLFIPEFEGCLTSNLVYFSNGDNQEENFNSTRMEITDVKEESDHYMLTGTFSGKITEDGGDNEVLDISNGSFIVSVLKQ